MLSSRWLPESSHSLQAPSAKKEGQIRPPKSGPVITLYSFFGPTQPARGSRLSSKIVDQPLGWCKVPNLNIVSATWDGFVPRRSDVASGHVFESLPRRY